MNTTSKPSKAPGNDGKGATAPVSGSARSMIERPERGCKHTNMHLASQYFGLTSLVLCVESGARLLGGVRI